MDSKEPGTVLYARHVDPEAKQRFKIACLEQGITISEGLNRLFRRLAEDKGLLGKQEVLNN